MKPLKFTIPESWNQLSDWQFENIAYILSTKNIGIKETKRILRILLNIKWYSIRKRAKLYLLFLNVPLSELRNHFKYIFENNDRTVFINAFKKKDLHPPMDRIINLTAEEFAAADDLHIKWRQKKDPEYLQYLAAVLYTPSPRPQFDKLNLNQAVIPFRKLSIKKLLAIEIAFFGSKNNMVKRFPKAFPKNSKPTPKKYGFGKVILEMTHGDLSKHEAVKTTNIYTFLEQFQQDIINAEKSKRKK